MTNPTKTPPRAKRLQALLVGLLITFATALTSLAGGCTLFRSSSPQAPSSPPPVSCPLPSEPIPPALSPASADGSVTLTPNEAVALGEYIRALKHRDEMATACLAGEAPKAFVGPSGDESPRVTPVVLADSLVALQSLADRLSPGVRVEMIDCLTPNAITWPRSHLIQVCRNLEPFLASIIGSFDAVSALRFVVAHEAGHDRINADNIPITGSEEEAADEFAAVELTAFGEPEDVLAMGRFFILHASPPDPTDEHPDDAKRGVYLTCDAAGAIDPDNYPGCASRFYRAVRNWSRLLED